MAKGVLSLTIVVVLLELCGQICCQNNEICSSPETSMFKFNVKNHRNESGHYAVTVVMENYVDTNMKRRDQDLLSVEVGQRNSLCNGAEDVTTTVQVVAPPSKSPRLDYELFPNLGYYKMHTIAATWEQARQSCVREGSHLLILNSDAEVDVVKKMFSRSPKLQGATWNDWAFIGFHDHAFEGLYLTLFGESLTSVGYNKWYSGQPDNNPWGTDKDQDCGVVHSGGLLGDAPCSSKLPFICEQEL